MRFDPARSVKGTFYRLALIAAFYLSAVQLGVLRSSLPGWSRWLAFLSVAPLWQAVRVDCRTLSTIAVLLNSVDRRAVVRVRFGPTPSSRQAARTTCRVYVCWLNGALNALLWHLCQILYPAKCVCLCAPRCTPMCVLFARSPHCTVPQCTRPSVATIFLMPDPSKTRPSSAPFVSAAAF